MSLLKKISLVLVIVFIVIQFIRPSRNTSGNAWPAEITTQFSVPGDVQSVLRTSCYDCHTNNTRYPWYSNIQPLGWLLANHINDGKANLNFDKFGNYSKRRQLSKLKAITNSIKDGTMPLFSYTLLHHDARLSKENKDLIVNWISGARDSLEIRSKQ